MDLVSTEESAVKWFDDCIWPMGIVSTPKVVVIKQRKLSMPCLCHTGASTAVPISV